MITDLLQLLAAFCAALFAAAAVYINAVEHPARMSLPATAALAEWRPSYKRGALLQAPLAVVGLLAAIGAWATGAGVAWLVGGGVRLTARDYVTAFDGIGTDENDSEAWNDLAFGAGLTFRF